MSQNFSLRTYEGRNLYILIAIIVGLVSSKALISIGTVALFANLFLSFREHSFSFLKKTNFPFLTFIIYFAALCTWLFLAPDKAKAATELAQNAAWLIFPLSIMALKNTTKQYIYFFLGILVVVSSVSSLVVLANYFSYFEFYTKLISKGQNIAAPHGHIRFSMVVSFASLVAVYFTFFKAPFISRFDKRIFPLCATILVVTLHIISVRSGLVTFYVGLVFIAIAHAFMSKKWWLIPIVLLFASSAPFIAYKSIPSFTNKIDYMRYDWQQMNSGNINWYSDTKRVISYKMGLELIKEKPFLGHGLGYGEHVSRAYFVKHFPDVTFKNRILPHNQFLLIGVEIGLLGLLIFLFVIMIPLVYAIKNKNILFITLWLVVMTSCLVENNLSSYVILTLFTLFSSLLLKLNTDADA